MIDFKNRAAAWIDEGGPVVATLMNARGVAYLNRKPMPPIA